MLGAREAVAVEVRRYDIHGVAHVEVTLRFPDGRVEAARLGQESVPEDLQAGERVVVRLVMSTIVEIRRASA